MICADFIGNLQYSQHQYTESMKSYETAIGLTGTIACPEEKHR